MARSNVGYVRRMDRVPYQRQCAREPRRMRAQQGSATVKALSAIGVGAVGAGVGEYLFAYRKINGATQLERAGSQLSNMTGITLAYHRALPAVTGFVMAEAPFLLALAVVRLFTRGRRTAAQVQKITPSDVVAERKLTIAPQPAAPGALPDILVRKSDPRQLAVSFPASPAAPSAASVSFPVSVMAPVSPQANGEVKGLKQGDRISVIADTYVILEKLGAGGMGRVWKARHEATGKTIAIKELTLDDQDARSRFWKEAGAIRDLSHRPRRTDGQWDPLDGVVGYEGFTEVSGTATCYLFMEFIDGQPLSRFVEGLERDYSQYQGMETGAKMRLLVLSKVSLFHYLVLTLGEVYKLARIMHRDLKMDNVFVMKDAQERAFIKVLDWGLAKDLTENISQAGKEGLTEAGGFMGTFSYAAPEVFWAAFTTPDGQPYDRKEISIQADMYSLGVMLYRALVGRPPFETDNYIKLHTSKEVPQLIIPDFIPPRTGELLHKLLARDPGARPRDHGELARLFEAAESEISSQN